MSDQQRGDRLGVSELSRFGRSLGQFVAILDAFAKAGVAFVAIKENIRVEGKHDIRTRVSVFSYCGQKWDHIVAVSKCLRGSWTQGGCVLGP